MIRPATIDDSEAIAEVHVATWRTAYAGLVPQAHLNGLSVQDRAAAWRTIGSVRGQATSIAEDEGRVIGFANAGPNRDADAQDDDGEIRALYVAPASWNRGVGRALHDRAIQSLRESGFQRATLWVLEGNSPARAFYERCGWRLDDRSATRVFAGQEVVEVRYAMDLGTTGTHPAGQRASEDSAARTLEVCTVPDNPTERFTSRAGDYVRFRPSYPSNAIDAVLAGLGSPGEPIAADVGAGTGISARLLAERGVRVIAVEPNRAMRESAVPHACIKWIDARAESTGLEAASVDLVLCAQAFHWFRAREALREFSRILRPDGRLVLMWNRRSREDPFTVAYRQAIRDAGVERAAERMDFEPEIVPGSGLFAHLLRHEYLNQQRLDVEGLIGRAMSASYVPTSGPSAVRLVDTLRDLHGRHEDASGLVTLVYTTEVFVAERTSA